jgi:endonuclease I
MKKLLLLSLFLCLNAVAQVPAYYSSIDFSQSGSSIKSQLASLISTTHNQITYTMVWDVLKVADLETGSSTMVALTYGYNDGDGNPVTDRTRDKNANGGNNGEWNREHVYAKSMGNPDLGTSGPGADAHNLRACDVQQNNNRASKKFVSGSGNAGTSGSDWYPGDEWKGDCARIVMYMYLRYGTQCLPSAAGTGTVNTIDPNMVDLFLDWNADDAVSQFEKDRNDAIQNAQGNRNPFIDNPRIATLIWGGPIAEDTWGGVGFSEDKVEDIMVYPTPISDGTFFITGLHTSSVSSLELYDISGKIVERIDIQYLNDNQSVHVDDLESGTYILSLTFDEISVRRKIIIQ